jgi:anti-sigma regulatory factor (Ser/Thr protein kinase)
MRHDDVTLPAALTRKRGEDGFHHETLFYSGEGGFLTGTVQFIEDALCAEEPVLVAVSQAKITLLQEALGEDAQRVTFADMCVLGSNPARIIPAWRKFLHDCASDGRPVRGIGEPIWAGRSAAELTECQRHESLLNVAFDDGQAWRLLCPYDVDALDDCVIEAAHRSHPVISEDGVSHSSSAYVTLEDGWTPFEGSLPAPRSPARELEFTSEELAALRRRVAGAAAACPMRGERADDLVLAVNELASNSIQHGGGRGTMRVWQEADTLLCEVSDRGRFNEPLVGRVHPCPDRWSGRGLWMANQLCDLVQIRSSDEGSVVRVHMRVKASDQLPEEAPAEQVHTNGGRS